MFRILFIVTLFAFTSCVSRKSLIYFNVSSQKEVSHPADSLNSLVALNKYKIREGDILAIKITSLDPSITGFFNIDSDNKNNPYNEASVYLNSYSVDDSGFVDLPIIKKLHVEGLRLAEISQLIKSSLSRQVTNPTVSVKLVNFKITVLGEVKKPDTYKIYSDNISITEALGMAGDITEYGSRKKVKVIRNSGKGLEQHYINLTNSEALNSEFYNLMPGDVVFVEPNVLRPLNTTLAPVRVILLGASLVILVLRVTNNL